MQLVAAVDDAIERMLAVPGCDSLDAAGVDAFSISWACSTQPTFPRPTVADAGLASSKPG